MTFCNVSTVGELIDALQHFSADMPVEIVSNAYAKRQIKSVEQSAADYDHEDTVQIIPND